MTTDTPKHLFTLPIPSTSGTITITLPKPTTHPKTYLLTITSPPDNRLTPTFISTFLQSLDILRHTYPPGILITTSSIQKFYSNGLDLPLAQKTPRFFEDILFNFMKYLLNYPFLTISLINGHAFAGGFITAMLHDYRIMNPEKGFLCMNELEFGAPLFPPLTSIFRDKLSAKTYRSVILEAKRFSGPEALKEDVVDKLGGLSQVFELIDERKLELKSQSPVYNVLRREMWKSTWGYVKGDCEETKDMGEWMKESFRLEDEYSERARVSTEKWEEEKAKSKAKL